MSGHNAYSSGGDVEAGPAALLHHSNPFAVLPAKAAGHPAADRGKAGGGPRPCCASPPASERRAAGGAGPAAMPGGSAQQQSTHTAKFAYVANDEDEISLAKGDSLRVTKQDSDGWFTGTNLRTGATGDFPGNYVVAGALPAGAGRRPGHKRAGSNGTTPFLQARSRSRRGHSRSASLPGTDEMAMAATEAQRALLEEEAAADADFEQFEIRQLGSVNLPGPGCSEADVVATIAETLATRKKLKMVTTSLYELRVHRCGVRMLDKGTTTKTSSRAIRKAASEAHRAGGPTVFYPLRWLSTAAFSPETPQCFAFATLEPGAAASQCHVFRYDRSSVAIVNAITRASR